MASIELELSEIKNKVDNEIKIREDNINKYIAKNKFFNNLSTSTKAKLNYKLVTNNDDSNLSRFLCNKFSANYNLTILENDFKYESEKQYNNLKSIISFMKYIFARYHNKIGGQLFEDDWILYSNNSKQTKYELKENEYIFDNSINLIYRKDANTINYIKKLHDLFQEVTKESKFKVSLKMMEDEHHNIIMVIFMLKERK